MMSYDEPVIVLVRVDVAPTFALLYGVYSISTVQSNANTYILSGNVDCCIILEAPYLHESRHEHAMETVKAWIISKSDYLAYCFKCLGAGKLIIGLTGVE
ncbi:hypothetical protein Tco_0343657 [Tanacetum coccineum]